jgi:hypothetical protein
MRFFRNPEEFDSKESKSDVPQLSTNLTSNKKNKKKNTLGVRNSIYNLMMMVSEIPNLKSWDDSPFSTRQGADSQRQCHVTSCVWVKSPHGLTTPDSV